MKIKIERIDLLIFGIFIGSLTLISLVGLGYAESFCLNNNTLTTNITVVLGNNLKNVNTTETCQFGCDLLNNKCNPDPSTQNLIFVIIFFAIIVVIIIFLRRMK